MGMTVIVVDFTNAEIPDDEQALKDYFGLVKMPEGARFDNARVESFVQRFDVTPPVAAKCFRALTKEFDVGHLTIIFRGLAANFDKGEVPQEVIDHLSAFYADFFSKIGLREVPKIDTAVSVDDEIIADIYIDMGPFNAFLSECNRDHIREQNKD
jgi:hypothetical protein